jgi:hypothetical protein
MNQPPIFAPQFLDDDGTPLAAGKLYTYASGTTTPQTSYMTQAGDPGDENANPIVLNARGECLLWLDPALEYTFKLVRADDTEVWTRDDVVGSAGGAGVVTSVNTETGAVVLSADDIGFATATATSWFVGTDVSAALDDIIAKVDSGFTAAQIPVADAGGYYSAVNVETALQEVAADVASLSAAAAIDELPSQTGHAGKYLTTNGSAASWSNEIPSQTGNSGKVLTTNGSTVSWAAASNALPDQGGHSGKFLTTDGSNASWVASTADLPSQAGNAGKVLMTNGSAASWDTEIPSQSGNSGKFLTTNGSATSWGTAGAGTSTQAATGTMTLPSGIIMKWGTTGSIAQDTANVAVSFASPFPNNCFMVTGTPSSALGASGSTSKYGLSIHTFTTTGFIVDNDANASTLTWFAIGN